jgi:RNA polymerase sigma factor (sigma-70 family)
MAVTDEQARVSYVIWERARAGRRYGLGSVEAGMLIDEFEQLVSQHHNRLLRLAQVMSGDRDLAEDAVQACWHALWQAGDQIRDPERVDAWLRTVTMNEVRRQLRRQRMRGILQGRLRMPEPVLPTDARHLDLRRALAGLDLRDRQLLALRFGVGLSSAEIGAQLGMSAPAARVRLQRVLARLRKELDGD